jgi:DNA-binding NtrC family response regulator
MTDKETGDASKLGLVGSFRRVLIVEDNDILLRHLVHAFESWQIEVVTAGTVAQATSLLAPPVDLLLADVRLPDATSHVLFERALRLESRPLLIAISGRASPAQAFELAKLGVQLYLAKPFSKPQLAQSIRAALDSRTQHA